MGGSGVGFREGVRDGVLLAAIDIGFAVTVPVVANSTRLVTDWEVRNMSAGQNKL